MCLACCEASSAAGSAGPGLLTCVPGQYLPGAVAGPLTDLGARGKGRHGLDQVPARPQDDPLRQGVEHP
jgi:hypothetical protein